MLSIEQGKGLTFALGAARSYSQELSRMKYIPTKADDELTAWKRTWWGR
jgi:hypothetical protein